MARTAAEITTAETAFTSSLSGMTAVQAAHAISARYNLGGNGIEGRFAKIVRGPASADIAQALAHATGIVNALTALQGKL